MRSITFLVTQMLLVAPAAAVPGPGPAQWKPATLFVVPPAADRCAAIETFESGGETLRFAIDARPTTDQFAVLIEAPGSLGGRPWVEGQFTLGDAKLERDLVVVESAARAGSIIYQLKAQRGELNSAGANPQLQVQTKQPRLNMDLQITGVETALSLLDACASSLLEKWGYSKDLQRQLANYPKPERNLFTYARSSDYPRSAVAAGAMGEAHVLVSVGVDRRASDCRIIRSSGHRDIDAMTCKIVTARVRYEPARDVNGNPVNAPAYLTMRWELPR